MLGYWNNDEETNKVLKNGWLHTGDIGVFENGYYEGEFRDGLFHGKGFLKYE